MLQIIISLFPIVFQAYVAYVLNKCGHSTLASIIIIGVIIAVLFAIFGAAISLGMLETNNFDSV